MKMRIRKIGLVLIACFLAAAASSCGEKGKSGVSAPASDALGRLIISYAGEVDTTDFSADSVVSLRALDADGAPGQAFASVEIFNERRFIGEKISVELMKKRGFIVEFRDKELLRMPLWDLDQGYNNVGKLDRSSTFVADNILEVMKEKDIGSEDMAFFLGHFGDMDITAAEGKQTDEEWREWSRTFRGLLKVWARRPDFFRILPFPEDLFRRNVGALERKQQFDAAMAYLFVLSEDKTGEYKQWRSRVFKAAVEMFLQETADAFMGKSPEPQDIRDVTGFMYDLRDVFIKKYLPEGEKLPESEFEVVDEFFRAKVQLDMDFDARRRLWYVIKDIKMLIDYDEATGAEENIAGFAEAFNSVVEKSSLGLEILRGAALKENDMKKYFRDMPGEVRDWRKVMEEGGKPPKESAKKPGEGAADEGSADSVSAEDVNGAPAQEAAAEENTEVDKKATPEEKPGEEPDN